MIEDNVIWSEGLLLSPQHFQQQDRHHKSCTKFLLKSICSTEYGFTRLVLNKVHLASSKFTIDQCEGIFRDGTPFSLSSPLSIDIPDGYSNKKIYLLLPSNGFIDNTGSEPATSSATFTRKEKSLTDCTQEDGDVLPVDLASLNLRLELEPNVRGHLNLLEVAVVVESDSKVGILLSDCFIPPCIDYKVSDLLKDRVSEVCSAMLSRGQAIEERIFAGNNAVSYQAQLKDIQTLRLVNHWNQKIGSWEWSYTLKGTSYVYSQLVLLLAELRANEGKSLELCPAWQPSKAYELLATMIDKILSHLRSKETYTVTKLDWDKRLFPTHFLLLAHVNRNLLSTGRFVVSVSCDLGVDHLLESFPRSIKLSGQRDISVLVKNSLSGVPLRALPFAPNELVANHRSAYFEVDNTSPYWKKIIERQEPIALQIDEQFYNANIELFVIG